MNKFKAEGLSNGFPDLTIPYARHGYHGLFIEMKFGRGKPSPEQVSWLDFLAEQGYLAVVCWSAEEAIKAVQEYFAT
ncbi:MAG: VRR-NUC domain-containing protein [Candidatus Paceibacterota bacterium]